MRGKAVANFHTHFTITMRGAVIYNILFRSQSGFSLTVKCSSDFVKKGVSSIVIVSLSSSVVDAIQNEK
jgi:uncharacterized protein YbcV (DUF1398 family)